MTKLLPLTRKVEVPSTSHILYFFESITYYVENMLAYMKSGIDQGHHIIIIENPEIYKRAVKRINQLFSITEREYIHYVDNYSFYRCYGDFHINSIVDRFGNMLEPYLCENINVRTWAHVEWNDQVDITCTMDDYERVADCSVNKMGLMSICAYDATNANAALQTSLMRSHEFLMTDKELVRSSLYGNKHIKERS
ncbi:MEDS domain-containing protein [Ornithinibacillus salinisoli]|uniref:MEDS domain-containing protein n=1 Tax=Ornithinibacillus salinisoli TaxID=1848459 RepID=A0ABW4W5A6_9BACI